MYEIVVPTGDLPSSAEPDQFCKSCFIVVLVQVLLVATHIATKRWLTTTPPSTCHPPTSPTLHTRASNH